jgi:hypothetical protein
VIDLASLSEEELYQCLIEHMGIVGEKISKARPAPFVAHAVSSLLSPIHAVFPDMGQNASRKVFANGTTWEQAIRPCPAQRQGRS